MKRFLLAVWATLLSGASLALGQSTVPPTPPEEATLPAPQPAPATQASAPAPLNASAAVDPNPWNPTVAQGARWPYPEPHHSWLSGLCPDLDEFWLGADYLLWSMRPARLPALATSSPAASLGILDQPGTRVVLGNAEVNGQAFSGGHFTGGVWLDEEHVFGLEGTYFFLAEQSRTLGAVSSGTLDAPLLAHPFLNAFTNQEAAQIVALGGQQAGSIQVVTTTSLQGAEATSSIGLVGGANWCTELLLGFRYLELKEELGIAEQINFLAGAPGNAGAQINQADQFDVRNHYYAGQIGLRTEGCWRGWVLGVTGKLALGGNEELVNIAGLSRFAPAVGMPLVSSGRSTRTRFAAVPEVGVRIGYQLTRHVGLFAGYNFLYWSDVVRAGNQIDRTVNATQVPVVQPSGPLQGPARPAFAFQASDFWAQGGTFGLEIRY